MIEEHETAKHAEEEAEIAAMESSEQLAVDDQSAQDTPEAQKDSEDAAENTVNADQVEVEADETDSDVQHEQSELSDYRPVFSNAALEVSTAPVLYVGIGASAGGLEALRDFFDHMSADSDAAFIVVQHLSPDFESLMDELLARNTSMSVENVVHGVEVLANTIYLIPPKKNITLVDGSLYLSEQVRQGGINLPIDHFFALSPRMRDTEPWVSYCPAQGVMEVAVSRR